MTFSRVAMPERSGGILTIPGYRVSVWANGISAGARGIAALCSAAQRGDSVARLAPVSHSTPSPGPTGGCHGAAGTAGAGTPQQEGRCAAASGTGQQVVRGVKAASGACGGVGRQWPGLRAGQGGSVPSRGVLSPSAPLRQRARPWHGAARCCRRGWGLLLCRRGLLRTGLLWAHVEARAGAPASPRRTGTRRQGAPS